ncbi:COG4-domain-containing protein [Amylocystis lapponica]|nr:COG4-domain-containing protein [Amylocystis lapponica]
MSVAIEQHDNSADINGSHKIRRNPRTLATLPDILSCLSALQSEEAEISTSLSGILSAREPIVNSLARLQSLTPRLDGLSSEALLLSRTVSSTAKTAEHVGGRVRSLDEEMRRVRDAAERVGQVMELKSSLSALQSSMDARDWESATRHCARAMALPSDVTLGALAQTAVPTSESHLPPAQTLQNAREELLDIFRQEFEKASQSRDATATSRFFKLFPAIGWEAEGLQAYASFVIDLVKVRAPSSAKTSSPLYFVTALTALFESIAMIVDHHQPVVEKYYGPGKMTSVLERLLKESDRVVKDLIEGWEEERTMKRKLSDITSAETISATTPMTRRQPLQPSEEDDVVDPREIDKVLTEAAGMGGRWELFRKFMYDRLKDDVVEDRPPNGDTSRKFHQAKSPDVTSSALEGLQVIEACASRQLFEDMLETYYIPLEVWYARTIINKAHRLSNADLSQSPAVTTTPDDAFYILKVVLMRMLSCGSSTIIQRTSELLRDVMDREYIAVIKKKLDDVYRTAGAVGGPKGEKAERDNRQAFIILLNDLDISSSHMDRLVKELCSSTLVQNFLDVEVTSVQNSITSFMNLVPKFRSTLRAGVEQLFNQLMRPKLRTFIPDVYKDVLYVLDEDAYGAAEYNDTVRKRFIKAWEALVEGYKETFTESNYRLLFGLAIDILVRPWERFVVSIKYSELGAIRFDQDLRSITSYLSSQTAFGDIREKFVRLQQISILLNLDSEEDVDEFYNGSGIAWQLSEQEARTITNLRVSP